jgi:flagellar hook assembly protein FlgD
LNEQLDTEDVGLLRVYPNPSAAITTFDFGALDKDATLSLIIYDRFGKEVKTLARNQWVHAGTRIEWDGTNQFGSPVNDSWFIASYSLDGKLFALPVLRNSN